MCGRGDELNPVPPGLAVKFLLGDPMTPPPAEICPAAENEEVTDDVAIGKDVGSAEDPLDCNVRFCCGC